MISRRVLLGAGAAALMMSRISWAADAFPGALDHILLGCNDLQRGIDLVEQHTGVRATFGGVHPGRGTQNALLALGRMHYLEIIAPDPKQSELRQYQLIKDFTTPRLVTWAAHPGDLDALAKKLQAKGLAFEGPRDGSRARPDGRILKWRSLGVDDRGGLVPFFIQWNPDSPHPSTDAPSGCQIERFYAIDPNPEELEKIYRALGIDMKVERGDRAQLRAVIVGPKGTLNVTS